MGNMMSSMELKNIKLSDLFKIENFNNDKKSNSPSHHKETNSYKKDIYYITTTVIIVLTPLVVAGCIFLAIAWTK